MSQFKGPDVEKAFPKFQKNSSVLGLLLENLLRNGNETAMVEGQTGKTASFQDLLQQGTRIAAGLRSKGVTCGDYVIICCDKSIIAYSVLLGVFFTGATAVFYPIPHIDIVPKLTMGFPIKAVFCDTQYFEPLMKSVKLLKPQPSLMCTTDPKDKVLISLINSQEEFELYKVTNVSEHVPAIFFSSGTTGDPKGIQIKDLCIQYLGFGFNWNTKTFLLSSPMFWTSALMTFISSIFLKFTVIWSNSTVPRENLQLIQKYKVNVWFAGTGSLSRFVNEPKLKDFDLSSVKIAILGGENLVSSLYNEFSTKVLKNKAAVLNGLGSTEGGIIALMKPGQKFKMGLCGSLMPGVEIKIVDENHKVVPIGSLGEVCLRSMILTPGYWGRPDVNSTAFDDSGFFKTGDAGFFDEEGNLYLRGRFIDLINFKGVMISPSEAEDILLSHEAVLEAAVVGKPHPTDIQHATAYVVLNQGFTLSEEQLENFVNEKVDDNKRLRGGVHVLPQLPRTIIGKVVRKSLREL